MIWSIPSVYSLASYYTSFLDKTFVTRIPLIWFILMCIVYLLFEFSCIHSDYLHHWKPYYMCKEIFFLLWMKITVSYQNPSSHITFVLYIYIYIYITLHMWLVCALFTLLCVNKFNLKTKLWENQSQSLVFHVCSIPLHSCYLSI